MDIMGGGTFAIVIVFWVVVWGGLGVAIASNRGIERGTGFC